MSEPGLFAGLRGLIKKSYLLTTCLLWGRIEHSYADREINERVGISG